MGNSHDTEEKLIAEMSEIIGRAIELGRAHGAKETTDRIMQAATQAAEIRPDPQPQTTQHQTSTDARTRKYPYGYVSNNIRKALSENPRGLTFKGLASYINNQLEANIDESAIRNSAKQLTRGMDIMKDGSLYILPSADNQKEAPPSEEGEA